MEKRIITISREFGSGGRTIGKLVAEHLGIRCYDAELIQKLAAESGFDENYIKEAGEYTPGGFLASAFADRSFGPTIGKTIVDARVADAAEQAAAWRQASGQFRR